MRTLVIFLMLIHISGKPVQSQISLKMCVDSATHNHPRAKDKELISSITKNKLVNYNTSWYPSLDLKGQATYQSDVIEFDMEGPVPGLVFPSVPKDQYKVYIDLKQTIYDGGKIKQLKAVEELSSGMKLSETEKEIEDIKEGLINLYFNILKLQEQVEIMNITLSQLEEHKKVARSAIENGIALKSDLDLVEIEILDIQQEIENARQRKEASLEILRSYTGMNFSTETKLENTQFEPRHVPVERKELGIIDQNKDIIKKSADLVDASRMPVAFAFGQAGYGKPGLNMLNDEFDSYYLVGLGLQWNICDWGKTRREKNNLTHQISMLNNRKQELTENISRARINQMAQIDEHVENISNYSRILDLREKITQTYREQLNNGTIRTIDYLDVLNREKIVRIRLKSEEILLQQSIADYMLISGNLLFE